MSVERLYQERRSDCMAAISTGTGRDHEEADWKEKVMIQRGNQKSEIDFIHGSPRKNDPKVLEDKIPQPSGRALAA